MLAYVRDLVSRDAPLICLLISVKEFPVISRNDLRYFRCLQNKYEPLPFLNDYACEMNNRSNHILNESLARKYQSGDREALKDLIRRFNPQLRSKIYYHTRNKYSVHDISQDCWYVIITKLEELKFQVGFEAWALNIARNKSIDWIRHQQKERNRKSDSEQENSSSDQVEENDLRDARINEIRKSMNLISDAQRIVLELFYVENLSIKEISIVLGISSGTVKSRLYTAREYLKKTIK